LQISLQLVFNEGHDLGQKFITVLRSLHAAAWTCCDSPVPLFDKVGHEMAQAEVDVFKIGEHFPLAQALQKAQIRLAP
jgi:hypothetical protein